MNGQGKKDTWAEETCYLCTKSFCFTFQRYYAEFPFTARSENEASLVSGQEVVVLAKHDITGNTEWWLVDANGHQGYAPATYLRKVV